MKKYVATLRSVFSNRPFFMSVFAEGTNDQTNQGTGEETQQEGEKHSPKKEPTPSGSIGFEELIAKARKEERQKLYGEIEKQKEKVNNLLLVIEERDREIADLKKESKQFKKSIEDLEGKLADGTATNKTVSELTTTISVLERQLEELQAKYDQDVNSLKLESFKEKEIAKAGGQLIPELVTGNTEEEILQSIERAKQRYQEITQTAMSNVQMPMVNPSVHKISLADKTPDEISNMTPQDWAEYRKQLGLK